MSTTYSPTGADYSPTIPVLTDDDDQRATSYNPTGQRLGDNIEWTRKLLEDDVALYVPGYTSHKFEVDVGSGFFASGWEKTSSGAYPYFIQNSGTPYAISFPISPLIPYRCRIDWFGVTLCGAAGHGGVLPENAPLANLMRVARNAAPSAYGELIDVAGLPDGLTAGEYEAPFEMTKLLSTPHTYHADYLYFIRVYGEYGTNYQAGLRLQALHFEAIAV